MTAPALVTGGTGFVASHLVALLLDRRRRSEDELGIRYRPVEETVLDHRAAWSAQRDARSS